MSQKKINWKKVKAPQVRKLIEKLALPIKYSTKPEAVIKIQKLKLNPELIITALGEINQEGDTKTSSSHLEPRIIQLEKSVEFILQKLDILEKKLPSTPLINNTKHKSNLSKTILSIIRPEKSILVDDLIASNKLRKYTIDDIEKALNDLIDKEIIYPSEGISKIKVLDNFGRITRY